MIKREKESGSIIKGLSAIKKKEENNSDTKKKERWMKMANQKGDQEEEGERGEKNNQNNR